MEVFIGTVVRNARFRTAGHLVRIDWDAKRVLGEVPIVPANPGFERDPNPRGNTRGCRGIELLPDGVLATDYHSLRLFDAELRPRRTLSHGLMVGIHETCLEEQGKVWVTSTAVDAALAFDLETGALLEGYWPREMPSFQRPFSLEPLEIDKAGDNRTRFVAGTHLVNPSHLHLNAVATWRGEVFALFNAFGAIANLTTGEVVLRDARLERGHNLIILEDGTALLNDTHGPAVCLYELASARLLATIELRRFPWVRALERFARAANALKRPFTALRLAGAMCKPLFARGLAVAAGRVFVGISPASVLCIDLATHELVDAFSYSRDVHVCVHGLAARPGPGPGGSA